MSKLLGVIRPMLGKDAPEDLTLLAYPLIVQPKLDGFRCLVVDGVARTRSFKPIENKEIQAYLGRHEFNGLDGEIVVGSPNAPDAFERTTSYTRSRGKIGEPWAYHVFDDLSYSTQPFKNRYEELTARLVDWDDLNEYNPDGEFRIELVSSGMVDSAQEVLDLEAEYLEEGYEGVMLRDPKALYKHGRSGKKGPLLKVKRFIDFEAKITGVFERMHNANEATKDAFGRTERSSHQENKIGLDTLGGFVCEALNGPHEGQRFRVGTGFNDAQRQEIWDRFRRDCADDKQGFLVPNKLTGSTIKVKSFLVGAKDAPRFPVWLGFRAPEDMPDVGD